MCIWLIYLSQYKSTHNKYGNVYVWSDHIDTLSQGLYTTFRLDIYFTNNRINYEFDVIQEIFIVSQHFPKVLTCKEHRQSENSCNPLIHDNFLHNCSQGCSWQHAIQSPVPDEIEWTKKCCSYCAHSSSILKVVLGLFQDGLLGQVCCAVQCPVHAHITQDWASGVQRGQGLQYATCHGVLGWSETTANKRTRLLQFRILKFWIQPVCQLLCPIGFVVLCKVK